jgi:hypothetical protein
MQWNTGDKAKGNYKHRLKSGYVIDTSITWLPINTIVFTLRADTAEELELIISKPFSSRYFAHWLAYMLLI